MPIYKVPEENLSKLQSQIEKLQKRAAKLNVGMITFTLLDYEEVPYKRNGIEMIRRIHTIEIDGAAPKIAGWTFAATLQPLAAEDGTSLGNILRTVPGTDFAIPAQYRNAGNNCDHCHTDRRRNDTFILRSDSNDWKQVGRNCLRDFLGHQSPEAYATMAQILIDAAALGELAGDDGYDGMGGGRRVERFAAEEFLTIAAAMIRTYGFRSNKTAREFGGQSTSGAIDEFVNSDPDSRKKHFEEYSVIDADKAQAAEVYAWLQTLGQREDLNDYLYNLSLLGQGATFTTRNFGLAVSAIPTWAKEQEREINRKKRFEADTNSQYIGTIGERVVFTATIVYMNTYTSDFGTSHFYKMKTDEGNIVNYFASHDMKWETGNKLTLKGSVKKQAEREGIKQTSVTRCTLFVPKDIEKAIKKLRHADEKGIPYDPTRTNLDWQADNAAHETIRRLIDELTQSAQPQQEAK